MVNCPVCGKDVDDQKIDGGKSLADGGVPVTDPRFGTKHMHQKQWYYFCSMACRQRFIGNPARYLTPSAEA